MHDIVDRWRNDMKSKWCIVLYTLLFPVLSQAGLLSDLHHIRDRMHERPVVAGTVAGAAGGRVVRTLIEHPLLLGAGAVGIGTLYVLHKDHCHITGDTYGVHMWTCRGVQGSHPWKQEAKDLVTLNSANAKILAKNLTKSGEPRPGKGCAAHHIISSDQKKEYAIANVEVAKSYLKRCFININSSKNGVWLPHNKSGSACRGVYHRTMHTRSYYAEIARRLRLAYGRGNNRISSCRNVRNTLAKIKTDLQNGDMP